MNAYLPVFSTHVSNNTIETDTCHYVGLQIEHKLVDQHREIKWQREKKSSKNYIYIYIYIIYYISVHTGSNNQ